MNKLFNLLSFILHPIFYNYIGLLMIVQSVKLKYPSYNLDFKRLLLFSFLLHILLPLLCLPILKKMKLIKSIYAASKQERIPIISTVLVGQILFIKLLKLSFLPFIFSKFLISTMLVLCVLGLISVFYKLSLHASGIAILTVLSIYLFFYTKSPLVFYLIPLFIILSGVNITCRLYLKVHNQKQVYLGYFLSLTLSFFIFYAL